MLKRTIKSIIRSSGYEVRKVHSPNKVQTNDPLFTRWFGQGELIPDQELYRPLFSPWFGQGEFGKYYALAKPKTLVSADRCYILWILLRQAIHVNGDIWECGVYKGGTAAMMAAVLQDTKSSKKLFLFDTFEGMPETDPKKDWHKQGEFSDTSVEAVTSYVGCGELCNIRKGYIPDSFRGLESAQIALAHIDVDIYKSILDCLSFVWPRLSLGGFIVFDDYGFSSCPGARFAVDEFFAVKACIPLCLPTGQALIFKGVT
jgi:O-methyltransferase